MRNRGSLPSSRPQQELQGLARVLQAVARLFFREQPFVDGAFARIIHLVGDTRKAGVESREMQVVVHFMKQVSKGGSAAVAGADQPCQRGWQLLLDGLL